MTRISALQFHDHFRIEIENHCKNRDACIMVSTLSQTLVGAVKNNPYVKVNHETMEDGHLMLDYISRNETGAEDMICILIGLMQVQNTYPDDIEITENIFLH